VGPWPAGNSTDHNRKTHKFWSVEGELGQYGTVCY